MLIIFTTAGWKLNFEIKNKERLYCSYSFIINNLREKKVLNKKHDNRTRGKGKGKGNTVKRKLKKNENETNLVQNMNEEKDRETAIAKWYASTTIFMSAKFFKRFPTRELNILHSYPEEM